MFKIDMDKLSPFDTQVITLITLAPDQWALGTAPTLVCHHKELGWFRRHWIFGVQPGTPSGATNRLRRLSWRGQILLRREIRKIKRSAINLEAPETTAPPPSGWQFPPVTAQAGEFVLPAGTATGVQVMQARMNSGMARMQSNLHDAAYSRLMGQQQAVLPPSPLQGPLQQVTKQG